MIEQKLKGGERMGVIIALSCQRKEKKERMAKEGETF